MGANSRAKVRYVENKKYRNRKRRGTRIKGVRSMDSFVSWACSRYTLLCCLHKQCEVRDLVAKDMYANMQGTIIMVTVR